jgi:hypothetical protein
LFFALTTCQKFTPAICIKSTEIPNYQNTADGPNRTPAQKYPHKSGATVPLKTNLLVHGKETSEEQVARSVDDLSPAMKRLEVKIVYMHPTQDR